MILKETSNIAFNTACSHINTIVPRTEICKTVVSAIFAYFVLKYGPYHDRYEY